MIDRPIVVAPVSTCPSGATPAVGSGLCGGRITAGNAGAAVTVPAGAFPDGAQVALTPRSSWVVGSTTTQMVISPRSIALQLTINPPGGGAPITHFSTPLVIHFPAYRQRQPAYSVDGLHWIRIPRIAHPFLPSGQSDGWYLNTDGSVDVYNPPRDVLRPARPAAPTAVRASLRRGKLKLSWTPGRGDAGTNYLITCDGKRLAATSRTTASIDVHKSRCAARHSSELLVVARSRGRTVRSADRVRLTPIGTARAAATRWRVSMR